ncbi:hypothetical protein [Succinimonas sp.]|uniref:hypothetical protein n=1 Tax=Succinimonas sp. TaxID=1936151 RepID=UPI00386A6F30
MENKVLYTNLLHGSLNATTKDYEEFISSSVKMFPWSFYGSNHRRYVGIPETDTSTDVQDSNCFSELDRLVVRRNFAADEAEKDKIVKKLVHELEKTLEFFDEENEEYSSVERKIVDIEHTYNMRILGEVIQDIYVHHFDKPLYLIGICRSLLRYDFDEVRPWVNAMLTGLLDHPDERVKEYTVQLIDNWNAVELLPILKTLPVSTGWLRDYIKDVVENLEKENVLYQKAV